MTRPYSGILGSFQGTGTRNESDRSIVDASTVSWVNVSQLPNGWSHIVNVPKTVIDSGRVPFPHEFQASRVQSSELPGSDFINLITDVGC